MDKTAEFQGYKLGCVTVVDMAMGLAAADTIGAELGERLWGQNGHGLISFWNQDGGNPVTDDGDWIPGDGGWIENKDWTGDNTATKGQNIVYLGGSNYYGLHPSIGPVAPFNGPGGWMGAYNNSSLQPERTAPNPGTASSAPRF